MTDVTMSNTDAHGTYQVVFTVESAEEFMAAAARTEGFSTKKGKDLTDAILENEAATKMISTVTVTRDDHLVSIKHYTDGVLNDGPNGEPAHQTFNIFGFPPFFLKRYTNGKLNDGPHGEPAVHWADNFLEHWKDGERLSLKNLKDAPEDDGNDRGAKHRKSRFHLSLRLHPKR